MPQGNGASALSTSGAAPPTARLWQHGSLKPVDEEYQQWETKESHRSIPIPQDLSCLAAVLLIPGRPKPISQTTQRHLLKKIFVAT